MATDQLDIFQAAGIHIKAAILSQQKQREIIGYLSMRFDYDIVDTLRFCAELLENVNVHDAAATLRYQAAVIENQGEVNDY